MAAHAVLAGGKKANIAGGAIKKLFIGGKKLTSISF